MSRCHVQIIEENLLQDHFGQTDIWTLYATYGIPRPHKFVESISKGYFRLCPRIDFLQTLHINNSLYTNYENVFIELDS